MTVTACPRCGKTGFVRVETVIRGGDSFRGCYCGACDYSWTIGTAATNRATPARRPERSRRDGRE